MTQTEMFIEAIRNMVADGKIGTANECHTAAVRTVEIDMQTSRIAQSITNIGGVLSAQCGAKNIVLKSIKKRP